MGASHIPRLVKSHHLLGTLHGTHLLGRFNARIAVKMTGLLSNMWFFWFCVLLDLYSLPQVLSGQMTVGAYLSSVVIQLLALPIIGAGQALQQAANDARAEADHATLTSLHDMNVTQLAILQKIDAIEGKLNATNTTPK